MLGLALGSLVFGLLSDKIGRRHTLLIAILTTRLKLKKSFFAFWSLLNIMSLSSLASLVASYMPGYVPYAILRIIIGAGAEGWSEQVFTHNTCTNAKKILSVFSSASL